ncbi:MAG: hypothetical protein ACYS0G_05685 [Planctomycetota bacterium]
MTSSTPNEPTPPTPPADRPSGFLPRPQDEEHLKLLSIFYYVYGGLTALLSCFGLIYVAVGVGIGTHADEIGRGDADAPPPEAIELFAWLFSGVGFCVMFVQWIIAGLLIYTARCLALRRYRIFCIVVAALICLSVPLGTALGVFTFLVLSRPGVVGLFGKATGAVSSAP